MSLRNKKILITAGPTWVALDSVRVITNIATGQTGFLLSKEAEKRGCAVTLALGPVEDIDKLSGVSIKRFRYFNELLCLIKKELASRKYDIVIHSAAVSDYEPVRFIKGKISSSSGDLNIRFRPTKKIVNYIKRINPGVFLVLFKLECGAGDGLLISRTQEALRKSRGDLAVANRLTPRYKAFIVGQEKLYTKANSKQELTRKLFNIICSKI